MEKTTQSPNSHRATEYAKNVGCIVVGAAVMAGVLYPIGLNKGIDQCREGKAPAVTTSDSFSDRLGYFVATSVCRVDVEQPVSPAPISGGEYFSV